MNRLLWGLALFSIFSSHAAYSKDEKPDKEKKQGQTQIATTPSSPSASAPDRAFGAASGAIEVESDQYKKAKKEPSGK